MRRLLLTCWLLCLATLAGLPGTLQARGFRELPASSSPQGEVRGDVRLAELPAEARTTLRLIEQGGPYPYPRDGIVFGNHERRLPRQMRGYYREYTVPTPGLSHRGARRIIHGGSADSGENYYTADHYLSFRRIRP